MTATPLEEYLEYYKSLEEPGFAVLVTGEWGIGKTYQVKKAIEEKDYYYVSLFGLNTIAEVHSEVFLATIPTSEWWKSLIKPIAEIGKIAGGKAKFLEAIPTILQASIGKSIDKDKILIIDDLERSGLQEKDRSGVLNYYVEHVGCKVIVIAHDGELVKEFKDQKEKLFGQFFKVGMQTQAAFDAFAKEVKSNSAQEFIQQHQKEILGIFSQSGVHSLRILRHVIADISRLVAILDPDHLKHPQAMSELISLFCAFDIEMRNGGLSEECLNNRAGVLHGWEIKRNLPSRNSSATKKTIAETPKLIIANKKYSAVDMTSSLLSDELLNQFFVEGRYDQKTLKSCLDSSVFFTTAEQLPPWKIIINLDKFDDKTLERAVEQMNSDLENFKITNPGEIIHIFMLKIMMAKNAISKTTIATEVLNAKQYIDNLLSQDLLWPATTIYSEKYEFDRSYGGYCYWTDKQNDEFKQIMEHLRQARDKALENTLPKETKRLLALMRDDSKTFMDEVSYTHRGNGKFAETPILSSIVPKTFVEAWLSAPKENWSDIWMAFKNRYQSTIFESLKSEQEWVIEVGKVFQQKVSKAKGFSKMRIRRAYEFGIKPIIEKIENAKRTNSGQQ